MFSVHIRSYWWDKIICTKNQNAHVTMEHYEGIWCATSICYIYILNCIAWDFRNSAPTFLTFHPSTHWRIRGKKQPTVTVAKCYRVHRNLIFWINYMPVIESWNTLQKHQISFGWVSYNISWTVSWNMKWANLLKLNRLIDFLNFYRIDAMYSFMRKRE